MLVEAVWCGPADEGEVWLETLRALGPVLDTVQTMPLTQLTQLHMDPEEPAPGVGDGGMLTGLDDQTIDELVAGTVGAPILSTEVRHVGGAVARGAAHHGALAAFEAPYITYSVGIAPTPEAQAAVRSAVQRLRTRLEPWQAEHTYLNFSEGRRPAEAHFTEAAHHRLRKVKAAYDPRPRERHSNPPRGRRRIAVQADDRRRRRGSSLHQRPSGRDSTWTTSGLSANLTHPICASYVA